MDIDLLYMDVLGMFAKSHASSSRRQSLTVPFFQQGVPPIHRHVPLKQRLSNDKRFDIANEKWQNRKNSARGKERRRVSLLESLRQQNRQQRRRSDQSPPLPPPLAILGSAEHSVCSMKSLRWTSSPLLTTSAMKKRTSRDVATTTTLHNCPADDTSTIGRDEAVNNNNNGSSDEEATEAEICHETSTCSNASQDSQSSITINCFPSANFRNETKVNKTRSISAPCGKGKIMLQRSRSLSDKQICLVSVVSSVLPSIDLQRPPTEDTLFGQHRPNWDLPLLDSYLPSLLHKLAAMWDSYCSLPANGNAAKVSKTYDGKRPATPAIPKKEEHSVQTELCLLHADDQLDSYLDRFSSSYAYRSHSLGRHQHPKYGMDLLAKHFFEYQSFINIPDKSMQLHKTPPSHAGVDQSAFWAPKSNSKTGKNRAAPGARADRHHLVGLDRVGTSAKRHFRQWGDRHCHLKPEKVVHKDLWMKFFSGEDNTMRDVFETEFEENVLRLEPDTLLDQAGREDRLSLHTSHKRSEGANGEILLILTYAPTVQFVTVTLKMVKSVARSDNAFARVLLFEGRRALEQKQSASLSQSFLFHISPFKLALSHIVVEIYDRETDDVTTAEGRVVGHAVVGPLSGVRGALHWQQMARKPAHPVCMWHRLALRQHTL